MVEQSDPGALDLPFRRLRWAGALVSTLLGGAAFALLPPLDVMVGWTLVPQKVPWLYQVSVFPCFGWLMTSALLDSARAETRTSGFRRLALALLLSVVACFRLLGQLPLSGHGVFLGGVLSYATASRREADALPLAILALVATPITVWYKLLYWGDWQWGSISIVLGALTGLLAARAWRRPSAPAQG